jgi:uncharacterized SAM-binding protein YcdF (DUF218 family)
VKTTKSKNLKRVIIALVSFAFILIAGEIAYFYYILSQDVELEKADVIVVFSGSQDRIKAGFELADAGYAPIIIVSTATESQMENYRSKYSDSKDVSWIIEDQARNTTENALYTKDIMLKNHFESMILVTSKYHIPRSLLLMKMVSMGSKIRIQPHWESIGSKTMGENSRIGLTDSLFHDELFDFWGSLLEFLNYKIAD